MEKLMKCMNKELNDIYALLKEELSPEIMNEFRN